MKTSGNPDLTSASVGCVQVVPTSLKVVPDPITTSSRTIADAKYILQLTYRES